MFRAVLHGKVRGNQTSDGSGSYYQATEDFLTAAVFSRLNYLPAEVIWKLVRMASVVIPPDTVLPECIGLLRQVTFWPHWTFASEGREWLEPDIILEFDNLRLIVEAKLGDTGNLQRSEQWATEIAASFHPSNQGAGGQPWLLAIGGMGIDTDTRTSSSTLFQQATKLLDQEYGCAGQSLHVLACSWVRLNDAILEYLPDVDSDHGKRILRDVLEILNFHGICRRFKVDFQTLPIKVLNLQDASITFFSALTSRAVVNPVRASFGSVGILDSSINFFRGVLR